jgi:hypothetical protein
MRQLRTILAFIFFFALLLHAGDKKQKQAYYLKPGLTADLQPVKFTTAKQECENWAFAAGVESVLRRQGVDLNQNFWVMRLHGGELCTPDPPTMDALAKVINDEFVLDDGRHVRLELRFVPGAPADIDSVIAALQRQEPTLLVWRGHPYYLTGITYDEYVGRDGMKMFDVKELRLANTYAGLPGRSFEKGRDDPAEIDGILNVSVTFL